MSRGSSTRIFLVRHGETELNRLGVLQGRRDARLTEEGRDHAAALGVWLTSHFPAPAPLSIWSSPLGRAQATARIAAEHAGRADQIRIDQRLAEVDGGSFEGLTRDEAIRRSPGAAMHDVLLLLAADAEPYASVAGRLSAWLADVDGEGGDHLVITHAGAGRILRAIYCGRGRDAVRDIRLPHGAVYVLEKGAERRV